ncbi:MAG: hypothetical protein ACRDHZ_09885, partial [Ktedonobacteraceae bacterium]
CNCTRQLIGSVFCGIFCFPCAATRLIGFYTGCIKPERLTEMHKKQGGPIPGLEYCSSNNPCDGARGYKYVEYTEGQKDGSGFSRRTLDIINVTVTPFIWGTVAIYTGLHRD